jgi:hypothetical protein
MTSLSQFFGVGGAASNIVSGNQGIYSPEMFLEDFPQFTRKVPADPPGDPPFTFESLMPAPMLGMFISMANAAIQENRWFEKWRYAMGLFVAHYAALYLQSYAESSPTAKAAAGSGASVGAVKSASLGDSSVSYDTSASAAATEKWGSWNETSYGRTLVTEARLVALGGSYII